MNNRRFYLKIQQTGERFQEDPQSEICFYSFWELMMFLLRDQIIII